MNFKKGQGSTEYLVILAVVLIIALVAIAILGFFPGLATDAQKTQSDSYWQGVAYPFRIVESKATAGTLSVILQNANSQALTLNSMAAGGANATPGLPAVFLGGEKKLVQYNISIDGICGNGSTRYAVAGNTISFNYSSNALKYQMQGGDAAVKDLIGTCS
ncbi:MAG TPA: class III signal peptide-containing protein [Candidatus Micrarchaeota archaeon]|nr:class III signal peptide-containing protein [Candidatus Micrarchaeota archaeon]